MVGMANTRLLAYGINTSAYSAKPLTTFVGEMSDKEKEIAGKGKDVSKMRQALRKGAEPFRNEPVSVLDNMKTYTEKLKQQRAKASDTALAKKKVRYSFKNLSSKIISSKTAVAARQVVSQAKREIQKLKDAKRTGKYDTDEIDAAIDHAKAMERIARKKVRHLEEEEMAERSSSDERENGAAAAEAVDAECATRRKDPVEEEIDRLRDDAGRIKDKADKGEYIESEEITNEMISKITDGMEEILDSIEELNDLMDELTSNPVDMDPEDIKAMKIKHRNKEMKDITKADGDYLKAMFEHYEKVRSGEMPTGTEDTSGYPGGEAPSQVLDVAL